ncbi:hypothetical protein [Bifidobacterium ramosum]|uniref:Uncharacterized protein n=1 Tax=Bifidobacterium ramosum TaxID=1798158 RepID=A0A7K3TBS0_9BIFI|nr:hypothetical protein [Bifidobacterium ramosum]NEG71639.1 hypothetical protein [Bifidobacterium ramosum]
MGNSVVRRGEPAAAGEEWQGERRPVRRLIRRRLWQTFGPAFVVMVIAAMCVAGVWVTRWSVSWPLPPQEYALAAVGIIVVTAVVTLAVRSVTKRLPRDMVGVALGDDTALQLVRKPHDNRDLELEDPDFRITVILFPAGLTRVFKVLELTGGEADVCWTIMQVSGGRLRVVGRDAVDPQTRLACAEQYTTDDLAGIPIDDNCVYDQRNSVLIVR